MATVKTSVPLSLASVSVSMDAEGYFAQVGDWYVEVRGGKLVVRSAKRDLTVLTVGLEHRHAD